VSVAWSRPVEDRARRTLSSLDGRGPGCRSDGRMDAARERNASNLLAGVGPAAAVRAARRKPRPSVDAGGGVGGIGEASTSLVGDRGRVRRCPARPCHPSDPRRSTTSLPALRARAVRCLRAPHGLALDPRPRRIPLPSRTQQFAPEDRGRAEVHIRPRRRARARTRRPACPPTYERRGLQGPTERHREYARRAANGGAPHCARRPILEPGHRPVELSELVATAAGRWWGNPVSETCALTTRLAMP